MEIKGKKVILEGKEANRIYNKGAYGKFHGKKLYLNLIEACYLIEKGRLEGNFKNFIEHATKNEKDFEIKYLVYRDLRERGYILTIDNHFYLYERGKRPPSPPSYIVMPISERAIFSINRLAKWLQEIEKKLMIGIVDEEGDLTYYIAKFFKLKGSFDEHEYRGEVYLLKDRCIVWDEKLIDALKEDFIGKSLNNFMLLSLTEAAYIGERGVKIMKDEKEMKDDEFMKYAKKIQPDIMERFTIYKDLRGKGLLPKTGFKFGSHFRIYDKEPYATHAPYLVHVVKRNYRCSWAEISRAIRLAHSVKKEMIFAIVENDIKYIRLKRITP